MEQVKTRVGAVVLAFLVALVTSMGVAVQQVWADDGNNTAYDKTLTISGVASGDTVNAYKLISYDSGYHNMVIEGSFKTFLQAQDGNAAKSDNELAEWLKGQNSEQVRVLLKSYVNNWGDGTGQYTKPDVAVSVVGDGGNVSMTFNPGYYLVLPATTGDNSKLYNPLSAFVEVKGDSSILYAAGSQVADGAVATMKTADGPQIEKYVLRADTNTLKKTKTVAIGDTVTYAVKVTFPGYDSMGNPEFVLHDVLSGATYVDGSARVYNATGDTTYDSSAAIDGAVTVSIGATGEQLFTLNYSAIHAAQGATKSIFVVYDTTVQSSIVSSLTDNHYVGKNSAYLSYRTSADASTTSKTSTDAASIYSYAVTIAKTNKNGSALNGAKFKIYEKGQTDPLKFAQVTAADGGTYYVPAADGSVAELAAENTVEIRGIDASREYTIEESTTPNGYYAPAGKFNLELVSEKDGEEHTGNLSTSSVITAVETADQGLIQGGISGATYTVTVKNSTTPSLPTTGGVGTVVFAVVGIAIMTAAVTILVRRRKHQ